ncbi:MAG: hypothetical protein H0W85_10845 [Methylotenera sp.]|nr:hypothetical protein [Methylotenera sp.]
MTFSKNKYPWIFLIAIFFVIVPMQVEAETFNPPQQLRAKYTELKDELINSQFKRELYMNSKESPDHLKGEIYAVVDYPFATVDKALNDSSHWCDLLILHINIKYCYASVNKADTVLTVDLGSKEEQSLADTYQVKFNFQQIASESDYFALGLNAKDGPVGTSDYNILVEATPISDKKTFLHFTYAYSFGLKGRLAMSAYLATKGRSKVGFTVIEKSPDVKYIQGVRGVIERNTMRYYLAIDAFLAAINTPKENQVEKRFQTWYDSTRLYSKQLYEVEKEGYLAMKRKEYQRQQQPPG